MIYDNLVPFAFQWTYIRDKTIRHEGDSYSGMVTIHNEDGDVLKMYAYHSYELFGIGDAN